MDISKLISNICISGVAIDRPPNDSRIDIVHDMIYLLIKYKRWDAIDILLEIINPKTICIDDLLSILTITSWCKEELKQREKFFKGATFRLDCMCNGMLDGLE